MEHVVDISARASACRRIGDAALDDLHAAKGREILALAGREIVEHHDVVSFSDEVLDEMRSDESGAAGDEKTHD